MTKPKRRWRPYLSLRIRLALLFSLSLAVLLLLFGIFLYYQISRTLFLQVDTALQVAAAQAHINVGLANKQLAFQNTGANRRASRSLMDDFVIYLISADGQIWDKMGSGDEIQALTHLEPGYVTWTTSDGEVWRYYNLRLDDYGLKGWLQVAQELEKIQETLTNLRRQMSWGIPLAVLLAAVGGFFLSGRALRPINSVTETASSITATDLNQRIDYTGPNDEIGRLARTFNNMLDRIQHAFDRERRFTGDAAHELRTPLTALKGNIEVTLARPRTAAEYAATLENLSNQVDRLIQLSNSLLFMARLDQGESANLSDTAWADDLLSSVIDQISYQAHTKNISIEANIPPNLVFEGNIELLIRLFLNLLDNAIKYTAEGGAVAIRVQPQAGRIAVAVSDTGQGIAESHLPHLFERFYRADSARSRINGHGGTGLGLAIVHEIARLHGGEITVDSEVGKGTTVWVELPGGQLAREQADTQPA